MKLFRSLIFIMAGLFVVGVVLVIFIDPSLVMSRVATGLTTGAFVGLISAVVNYVHARDSFFEKLSSSLLQIRDSLFNDLLETMDRIEALSKKNEDEIADYKKSFSEDSAAVRDIKSRYDAILDQIDFGCFAGILPWEKRVSKSFRDFDLFMSNNLRGLYSQMEFLCFSYFRYKSVLESSHPYNLKPTYGSLAHGNKSFQKVLEQNQVQVYEYAKSLLDAYQGRLPFSARMKLIRLVKTHEMVKQLFFVSQKGDGKGEAVPSMDDKEGKKNPLL